MASTYTDNFELEKQGVGDNVNTWGDPTLNTNVIGRLDSALGATTTIALTSSNVNLTQAQWRSKCLKLTGTISANLNIVLPLSVNSSGSATAVGGEFIVDNQTTGSFTITVKTAATGSTGVEVPQGFRSILYSDTVHVTYADDQARSTIQTYAGNPNGSVAGTAGSSTTPASMRYDRTNSILYVCTTSGDAASAVWVAINGPVTPPQGYLTASSDATNVILTADSIGATTIYYTPYIGETVPLYNGSVFVPTVIGQLSLALSASQAANGIYDVLIFLDGSTVRAGFSPSWAAGSGGSVTAGSCSRGSGVGGAAIQRIDGIWVNTAAMTVNNGASTYSVSAQRGTVVGTVFIDSTQGQVTCHRSFGASRKWGIWNFYNRQPLYLSAGNSSGDTDASASIHALGGETTNSLTVLAGLAEEPVQLRAYLLGDYSGTGTMANFIGWNSTSSPSGSGGAAQFTAALGGVPVGMTAAYDAGPSLGINVATHLSQMFFGFTMTIGAGERYNSIRAWWRG